jgi:hypothetical protein
MNRWKISTIMAAISEDRSLPYLRREAASLVLDAMRGVAHDSAEHVISRLPATTRHAAIGGVEWWARPWPTSADVEAALVAYARRRGIPMDAP